MTRLAGFWSYVHDDNRNDGDRILRLAARLGEEFQLLTGEPLELFVDRHDVRWGDAWATRIAEKLQETTFFIPVITPSYFEHAECRKELVRFTGEAKSLGLEELLLPIYYVGVPELERDEEPSDELMVLIKQTHWEDLREIRLLDEADARHRALVHKLAKRLAEIAIRTEAEGQEGAVGTQGETTKNQEGVEDEEPGLLEQLAEGEKTLPEWSETISALGLELDRFGQLTTEATEEMQAAEARGGGSFAKRLAMANKLARQLEEPADRIEQLGKRYASQLVTINPAILGLIRLAEEDPTARTPETRAMFAGLRELIETSRESVKGTQELVRVLDESAGFSRELRRPLKKINGALRNIVDGQAIIDEWEQRLNRLEDQDSSSESSE